LNERFTRETNICFPCGTQVTGFGYKHVTGFGTTALMAAPPVTVGSQNDNSA